MKQNSRLLPDRLCVDNKEAPRWVALFSGPHLCEFWRATNNPHLGAHHLARITQRHEQHRRLTAMIADDIPISFQIHDSKTQSNTAEESGKLDSGQMVPVTITADARADKPVQASFGRQLAGRFILINLDAGDGLSLRLSKKQSDSLSEAQKATLLECLPPLPEGACYIVRRAGFKTLINQQHLIEVEAKALLSAWQDHKVSSDETVPHCLYRGRDFVEQTELLYPDITVSLAEQIDVDEAELQAETALSESHICSNGAVLWIEPTRTAVMIDVDSAASKLGPSELAGDVLAEIIAALRLRQLSGRIIIDLPRVSKGRQKEIEGALRKVAATDPRHPDIIGFTASGLLEMKIRHGRMPLTQMIG